jgi:hypothetical protein
MGVRYKDVLARAAQDRHDWTSVGRKLVAEMGRLRADYALTTTGRY